MAAERCEVACWIGIGSNLRDPQQQVRDAFEALGQVRETELRSQSPLFSTPPMGPPNQPDYINAVAEVRTRLEPRALLEELQAIELAAGRRRVIRWGPRVLDLDLLTYGEEIVTEPGLEIPHPGIRHRNFVLLPLLSVAPELKIPGLGPVHRLAADIDAEGVVRLE